MSSVSQIVSDTSLFPPANLENTETIETIDWSQGTSSANIKQAVLNRLANFKFVENKGIKPTGISSYDELTRILPFSKNTAFFWRAAVYPTASSLHNSNYSVADQTATLIFIYARLLGFMGLPNKLESTMIPDGSSAEFGWSYPTQAKPKPHMPFRLCAFLTDPLSPITGERLDGEEVLKYIVSPEGNLGCIDVFPDSTAWCNELARFIYPNKIRGSISDNRRYCIAFYICPGGKLSVKFYILPPFRTPTQPNLDSRLLRREPVFAPLRELLPRLDASLLRPFNKVEEYFSTLEPNNRPGFAGIATDILPSKKNRFKVYCYHGTGLTLDQSRDVFTLGDRISHSEYLKSIEVYETLWNCLFPEANGSDTFNISKLMHRKSKEVNNIHYVGAIGYHIDIIPGEEDPVIKLYIPVRNYFESDAAIAERFQSFCNKLGYSDPMNMDRPSYIADDFEHAYPHRSLKDQAGGWLAISFAIKRKGWEISHYFSPENWLFLDQYRV